MILNQKKVKLENEDTTSRRNTASTLGIYLTDVKVKQFRKMDENRREKEEAKKVTAKKTATVKVHRQLKRYEAFDRCINSMDSLSLSNTNEESFIQLIQQSSNTINDAFVHIGGKLAELLNKIRDIVSIEMNLIMK